MYLCIFNNIITESAHRRCGVGVYISARHSHLRLGFLFGLAAILPSFYLSACFINKWGTGASIPSDKQNPIYCLEYQRQKGCDDDDGIER